MSSNLIEQHSSGDLTNNLDSLVVKEDSSKLITNIFNCII